MDAIGIILADPSLARPCVPCCQCHFSPH